MRLSTSTNIYFNRPDGGKAEIEASVRLCAAAGYRVMDMNFHDCTTFRNAFTEENWEEWTEGIAQAAAECGVEFSQAHAPFYNFCSRESVPDADWRDQMIRRSVLGSERLGVKWLAIHAGTDFDSQTPVRDSKRKNLEYLKPLAQYAADHGVGLAIENLWEANISPIRRYTATAEELAEFVDAFGTDTVKICWDFEHADIMRQDQKKALSVIGGRLAATHVSDNLGTQSDHILPFFGGTEWEAAMEALASIPYQGDLTYEIHRYTSRVPDGLVLPALRLSVEAGNYLLEVYEKYKNAFKQNRKNITVHENRTGAAAEISETADAGMEDKSV